MGGVAASSGKSILASPPFTGESLDRTLTLLVSVCVVGAVALLALPLFVSGADVGYHRSVAPGLSVLAIGIVFFLYILTSRRRSRQFIFFERGFQHHSPVKLHDGTRTHFIPYDLVKDVTVRKRRVVLSDRFAEYAKNADLPPAFAVTIHLKDGTKLPVSWQTFGREWMKPQEFLESMSKAFRMFLAMREMIAHSGGGPEDEKKARSLAAPSDDVTGAVD